MHGEDRWIWHLLSDGAFFAHCVLISVRSPCGGLKLLLGLPFSCGQQLPFVLFLPWMIMKSMVSRCFLFVKRMESWWIIYFFILAVILEYLVLFLEVHWVYVCFSNCFNRPGVVALRETFSFPFLCGSGRIRVRFLSLCFFIICLSYLSLLLAPSMWCILNVLCFIVIMKSLNLLTSSLHARFLTAVSVSFTPLGL